MNKPIKSVFVGAICILGCFAANLSAQATSLFPLTPEQQIRGAAGVFRGKVAEAQSYRDAIDGQIYTRTILQVEEVFKGKLPPAVSIIHRGGTFGDRVEVDGTAPRFKVGEERLLFVCRRADGTLFAMGGEAGALLLGPTAHGEMTLKELRSQTVHAQIPGSDLTDQASSIQPTAFSGPSGPMPLTLPSSTASNLLTDAGGIPSRFVLPDRGEGIPYLIDADYLPTGMTQTQALAAVRSALAAWTNATSVRYVFAGFQSFGKAAPNVSAADGVLRIQLHDHYNYIGTGSGGDTLGQAGYAAAEFNLSPGWTTGGRVSGNDFHKTVGGYIVLQHTNTFMQNIANFTEVLAHEIGHTIGLAHSSSSPGETNSLLKQSIMYYFVHGDGRGAALNLYDTNVSRQVHPPTNTPPYCYDRVLDVVTSPALPLNIPGVNSVEVRGYDLQTTNLSFATTDSTSNGGSFSVVNSNITYLPSAFYPDYPRVDPSGTSFYEIIYARYSDSVHASPYARIRVVSLNADTYSEGIPDTWRTVYFGSPDPSAGSKRHATNDFDGDGFTNLQEWLLGSNPTNKNSNLRATCFAATNIQWQAKGYEVYELCTSTNWINWTRVVNPVVPTNFVPGTNLFDLTNSLGSATGFTNGGTRGFFRLRRVP